MGGSTAKTEQLGMPWGTAVQRLRKAVLFDLLVRHAENFCCRCDGEIESAADLSMEHVEPWFGRDTSLFWDVSNIGFSHVHCNTRAGASPSAIPSPVDPPHSRSTRERRCRACTVGENEAEFEPRRNFCARCWRDISRLRMRRRRRARLRSVAGRTDTRLSSFDPKSGHV